MEFIATSQLRDDGGSDQDVSVEEISSGQILYTYIDVKKVIFPD